MLLKLGVLLAHLLVLLLVVDELPKQKISVILLARKLDLQGLVLQLQRLIIIINLLRNLRHGLQMLIQLLLPLLEVILIRLLPLRLSQDLVLDLLHLLVHVFEDFVPFLPELVTNIGLCILDLTMDFFAILS